MRYILSLLSISITLMGISSCSHSEKKKEKTSLNKGRAVITVNPKTLYSQLGVAGKMAARVLSENCIITDTLPLRPVSASGTPITCITVCIVILTGILMRLETTLRHIHFAEAAVQP